MDFHSPFTLPYHFVLLAADVGALAAIARWRSPRAFAWSALGVIALAAALAPPFEPDYFGILALYGHAVFFHGVAGLGGAAWLLRREARPASRTALALAALVAVIGIDAFWIEPYWLETTRVTVRSAKIRRPLRLVVLADLQTDVIGAYERSVLRRVMEERPDAILLLGDYLQEPDAPRRAVLREELRAALKEVGFAAPLGTVAVEGNSDGGDWVGLFDGFPVTAVRVTETIDVGELRVTALSMSDSWNPALQVPAETGFHIVMGHYPDFALGEVNADLLLAGHTHGGQVRLPFFGPIITFSRVPRAWAAGVTSLPGGRTLVVSRGVGMERERAPRLRFLCRPELTVIELVPEEKRD